MNCVSSSLIGLAMYFTPLSVDTEKPEVKLTDYQKAIRAVHSNDIRPNLPSEKMLHLCTPTLIRYLGPFTEYLFVLQPGYHGLTIVSKDGVLKEATEWSCT